MFLELCCILFSISYIYFLRKKKKVAFIFILFSNLISAVINFQIKAYFYGILNLMYAIWDIYLYYIWSSNDKLLSNINKKQTILSLGALLLTSAFITIKLFDGMSILMSLDILATCCSLISSILLTIKVIQSSLFDILSCVCLSILYILYGRYFLFGFQIVYSLLTIKCYLEWKGIDIKMFRVVS